MSFQDGIWTGQAENSNKENELRKKIKGYSKLVVNSLPLPKPSGGDCWLCYLRQMEGNKTLGECNHDVSHLESHLEEGYIVPSLVYRAMEEKGCGPYWNGVAFSNDYNAGDWQKKQVGKFVKRYLYRQFGLVS